MHLDLEAPVRRVLGAQRLETVSEILAVVTWNQSARDVRVTLVENERHLDHVVQRVDHLRRVPSLGELVLDDAEVAMVLADGLLDGAARLVVLQDDDARLAR